VGREGYARADLSYDVNGKRETWSYFDLEGKPIGQERLDCRGSVGEPWKRELEVRRRSFRECYQALLKTEHIELGKVAVRLQVDARGQVTFATISEDEMGSESLAQCVLQKVRKPFAHGADHGCASVSLPLTFTTD
jgi:hypothetical protein